MELGETVNKLIANLLEFHSAKHLNHLLEGCEELAIGECEYVGDSTHYNQYLVEWCISIYTQLYDASLQRRPDTIDEISVCVSYSDFIKAMRKKYGPREENIKPVQ